MKHTRVSKRGLYLHRQAERLMVAVVDALDDGVPAEVVAMVAHLDRVHPDLRLAPWHVRFESMVNACIVMFTLDAATASTGDRA